MSAKSAKKTATLTIASLAPGGAGVAHVEHGGERRAVFVPQTAPGDRVRVEMDLSTRPARGRVVDLIEPGEGRASPGCRWSAECGGCDWMHLSEAAQLREHADQVRAALPAAWRSFEIATHVAPASLGYRTRTRLHVRCGRGGRVVVGMNEAGTREPVEVDACVVLVPALEATRASLPAFFEGSGGRGEVQIALGHAHPVLDVRWSGELAPAAYARFERAVAAEAIDGVRITERDAKRPARIGDPTPWMTAGDGAPLRLAPGGFGQASERTNLALASHVSALAGDALQRFRPGETSAGPAAKAVELFAGAGNLSVLLARHPAIDLTCVESDTDACDAARQNLAARQLAARIVTADAAEYVWGPSTKLVVLDPPRTGARLVAERIAKSRVANVVYVSCDPQTLGRDLGILEDAYAPTSIATFEMFPQTSHVETVVALARRRT